MKKLGFVFLSILILSVGLFSCSKDNDDDSKDNDDDNPDASVYLPKKMYGTYEGNQWNTTFAYDSQNRLVNSTSVNRVGGSETVFTINYPANGQYEIQVSYSDDDDSYTLYTAEETGNVVEIERIGFYEGTAREPKEYYYTVENGHIVNCIFDVDDLRNYTYDSSGNITETTWRYKNDPANTRTMKYDDKKGIFSNIKTPAWILWDILDIGGINNPWFFVNNITELQRNNVLEKYEYTYNSDNYPTAIKITEYYTDGEEQIDVTIEY
ncbi:MAG: hypothetical protein LBL24_00540 [Bacteroidales bacterium]|jgi:hypothetical protein|nr:hypothetical protein [Bacteroidales bacterium]